MIVEQFEQELAKHETLKNFPIDIEVDDEKIVTLSGEVESWQQVVDIGHIAGAIDDVFSVVNNITVKGLEIPKPDHREDIERAREKGTIAEVDVLIIGAGVCGCAIARTLAKHQLNIAVVDSHDDVSMGASKANSGFIHPGHQAKPDTLKAKLNIKGNEMFRTLHEELQFTMDENGGYWVGYTEEDKKPILEYVDNAQRNGVPSCGPITIEELKEKEPQVKGEPIIAAQTPTMATVEPYDVVVSLANSAAKNGVQFILGAEVYAIDVVGPRQFVAVAAKGLVSARYIINASGVHADDVAEMVGDKFFTIHARRGTIPVFDKRVTYPYHAMVTIPARVHDAQSKGGYYAASPEGNIHIGPSATETPFKDDTASYQEDFDYAMQSGLEADPDLKASDVITFFTGVRAADYKEDFIIGMSKKVPGFINVAAIQSPGFVSAPAIAEMVEDILLEDSKAQGKTIELNENYDPYLKPKVEFRHLSREQQDELIKQNPKYGHVICRCETITEGEILDVIHSPVVPTSVDAIKRRTRAGMGRCQGGFCQAKVVEILARELGKEWTEINLKDEGSYILKDETRKEAPESCQI